MYQWIHPISGTVQLSGGPPAWYRSHGQSDAEGKNRSPRIFVFESGRLIDDTSISVSELQRLHLHAVAFGLNANDLVPQAEDPKVANLRRALEQASDSGIDVHAVTNAFSEERELEPEEPAALIENTVAQFKALLNAFDQQRVDTAKALLNAAQNSDGGSAGNTK